VDICVILPPSMRLVYVFHLEKPGTAGFSLSFSSRFPLRGRLGDRLGGRLGATGRGGIMTID
jgi:hypothetical protein